jgi:hypothetical protein
LPHRKPKLYLRFRNPWNRVGHVVTFLRDEQGRRPGPPITDVTISIKYVESPPEAYMRQDLKDLFRVSDEDERLQWRFALGGGFRESEIAVAETTDVNCDTKMILLASTPLGALWHAHSP